VGLTILKNKVKSRIGPIDGLRAFAVLGVMWAHTWMFFGGLPWIIGYVNIHQIISFGGIGVDLFFVISGFCMYLMHQKSASHFSAKNYGQFIFKRWRRIAPAFYVVVSFECLLILFKQNYFPVNNYLAHLFFVNTFSSEHILSPSFWSLSTEWQFYIILPLLFIKDSNGNRRVFRIITLMMICLLFRIYIYFQHATEMHAGLTIETDKIWYRFIEFGWGMLAAKIYGDRSPLPKFLQGLKGFVLAFLVASFGRIIMMTEFFNHFHSMAFLVRALGEPVLTLGFAGIILNVTEYKTIFSAGLSTAFMQFVGKISYSMYLWHWIIINSICQWFINRSLISPLYLNIAFLISFVIVLPVAWISYRLFEAPYFRSTRIPGQGAAISQMVPLNSRVK
jgi:peptidoglycan/LPS O-acetylase OafA/YrhL